ncbi:MAG: NfeD family protein [Pyrinomonadaceae bacterium]|jgi:membrane protein implicated in regulation of membrane protease activity|nr:NfeD family protein [Pyrinomonadaceae bacterium]
MEMLVPILWAVLGVILIIAEIFTPGFVLLWFGIGALAAALVSIIGFGYPLQFLVFFAISIALTALSRTIFNTYFTRGDTTSELKSGVDALPGQVGTVIAASRGAMHEGAVKLFGSTWTAYPAEGEDRLEAGERVVVEKVQGASLYVKRVRAIPEWREDTLSPPRGETEN